MLLVLAGIPTPICCICQVCVAFLGLHCPPVHVKTQKLFHEGVHTKLNTPTHSVFCCCLTSDGISWLILSNDVVHLFLPCFWFQTHKELFSVHLRQIAATSSVVALAGRSIAEAHIAVVATAEVRAALPVDDVAGMSSVVFVPGQPVTGGARRTLGVTTTAAGK